MSTVPAHVFRAYDIRGKAHEAISEELCEYVGKAFGSELRERYGTIHPTVIIGRDARTHSLALEAALITGLKSTGCSVKTIGQTPSPLNYFALCHFDAEGSVQVTASHNGPEDNGLKLQLKGAEAFAGEDLQSLRIRIEEGRFLHGEGMVESIDAIEPYLKKITSMITFQQPRTVVVDFGNGVAGPLYSKALRQCGVELIPLFEQPDGTFPNHPADPSQHDTLHTLIQTVQEQQAHCGLAFDGDGDRLGMVDSAGTIISPDSLLLLLAEDHLKRFPGAPIIYTVSMSSILESEISRMGGKPIMCKVGHSFVEHAMRKHGSHLGGEQSGHMFCGEAYFDFDDALVAALRVLALLPPNLNTRFPQTFQSPQWRPHCSDESKASVIAHITEHFQSEGYPCNTLDGVRIDFGRGAWAGIRQSNTSPCISVCIEARSPKHMHEIEHLIKEHLNTYSEIGN